MDDDNSMDVDKNSGGKNGAEKMFTLKKWNAVAMWS